MENSNQVPPVETPPKTAPSPETKKWYQHKAVLPVAILFVVAAAVSWIALSRQTKNDSSLVPVLNKDITIKGTLKPTVEGCSFIVTDNNQNYVIGKKPDDANYGDYIQATGKLSSDANICGTANLFIISGYAVLTPEQATTTSLTATSTNSQINSDTSQWEIYNNLKYNYQFKLPNEIGDGSQYGRDFYCDTATSSFAIYDQQKKPLFKMNGSNFVIINNSELTQKIFSTFKPIEPIVQADKNTWLKFTDTK
jgi:hypothetical protein